MKKKHIIGAVLAATVAFSATFTGCSLVSTNSQADMAQVIADVNISQAEGITAADSEIINKYKTAVGTTSIMKRDLVAYYLNAGANYVNSGYSYSAVFNMLVDSLVDNAVLTQYAIMYLLGVKAENEPGTDVLAQYNSKATYTEKLEYLLTDASEATGDPDDPEKEIKIAKYNLFKSINNAIDSYEEAIISQDKTASGTGSRQTPDGVDTDREDYYPKATAENEAEGFEVGDLYYNVYTGYNNYQLANSGIYKDEDAIDGSTKRTRIKAYNNFISIFRRNGLVDPETEDLRDVLNGISHIKSEYADQLESRAINKYYDLTEKQEEGKLTDNGEYAYLQAIYDDLYADQSDSYKTASSFSTAMDNMSDSSFVLYSPETDNGGVYGYVYNILLPFSALQSATLKQYQSDYAVPDLTNVYSPAYYAKRRTLLANIKSEDQRGVWLTGATDYSFEAGENGLTPADVKGEKTYYNGNNEQRNYLFFENNLTKTDRYEAIGKYVGDYSYNGRVIELEEGAYKLIPNKIGIDDMISEFVGYVDYVLGDEGTVSYTKNADYETVDLTDPAQLYTPETYNKKDAEKVINYKNFIYGSGKVEFATPVDDTAYRTEILNKETPSAQYKALSAVNELQYAYTTDTAVLSEYLGYSVAAGATSFIKEFETAAHEALKAGAGAFTVCAGDYGWHLIYVTYTFNNGNGAEYQPNWAENIYVDGTFENLFYEWVKSTDIKEISTYRRNKIITKYEKDNTVTKYQDAYRDLLDIS